MTESTYLISALSTQGEGISRAGGKVIFIPFVLPGETWAAGIIESKKNYSRALPREMLSPGDPPAGRIEPRCPYFGSCGGCHLQHMPYEDQLRWKRQWLEETFRRVAHLEVTAAAAIPSPPWEYRNKVTLRVTRIEGKIALGYHRIYEPDRLQPITDCPIAHPLIRKGIPLIVEGLNSLPAEIISPSSAHPHGSRVVIQVRESTLIVAVVDVKLSPPAQEKLAEVWLGKPSPVDGLILRDSAGGPPRVFARSGEKEDGGFFTTEAFRQVNDAVREKMYDHIVNLPFRGHGSVLDGYCGTGLLTRRLADRFKNVVGVEYDEDTVFLAEKQVEAGGLSRRVRIHCRTLEKFLKKSRESFDAWVLNPPRAGLSPEARSAVIRHRPPDCAIISCHPAALARDVKTLVDAGYMLAGLQPFDMFPQTHHLEAVAFLMRE